MINYYSETENFEKEEFWVKEYCRKFKNPAYILKEVADYHFNVCNDQERSEKYSALYNNYKPIDAPLLELYKKSIFMRIFQKMQKLPNVAILLPMRIYNSILCRISFLRWVKMQNHIL